MATLYWKGYKGLAKDPSGKEMQIPVGETERGKLTIPDSSTSTGTAVSSFRNATRIVKLKADADCQYYLSSPLKTADGNADLLFSGETEFEVLGTPERDTWALTVITKQ